jgi:hypothetical protein
MLNRFMKYRSTICNLQHEKKSNENLWKDILTHFNNKIHFEI